MTPALALAIATQVHHGQVDKAGQSILAHVLRVAAAVAHEGDKAMTVALLHDAVEDSDLTIVDIYEQFGPEIAQEVELLTHEPGLDYMAYIRRIKERGGIALAVKLADNADNADPRRLAQVPSLKVREALARKYAEARKILVG
jgi:(p)ppGpp synthase/HD superfamily hydrolase